MYIRRSCLAKIDLLSNIIAYAVYMLATEKTGSHRSLEEGDNCIFQNEKFDENNKSP